MAEKKDINTKEFYKEPMVLQVRTFLQNYPDDIVYTRKKPQALVIGKVEYLYIHDDYNNLHYYRHETVAGITAYRKVHYEKLLKEFKESQEQVDKPASGSVPEGLRVPDFTQYINEGQDKEEE